MALMDTIKKAMQGRSQTVERAVDGAVDRLGRLSDSLKKQGETVKGHARRLDETRGGTPAAAGPPSPSASGSADDLPSMDLTEAAPDAPAQGLRGSLVTGPATTDPPRSGPPSPSA